jgi:hypothetical protein
MSASALSAPSSSSSSPSRSLSGMLGEALSSQEYGSSGFGIRKLSSGTEADEELTLALDDGGSTPNDVRHFPPSPSPQPHHSHHPYLLSASLNVLGSQRLVPRRSDAVPIAQLDRSPHKLGADEEWALVEYRESLMYSRIVDFHQSRSRRNSLQTATTTAAGGGDATADKLPLLLRPRAHLEHNESSLLGMLTHHRGDHQPPRSRRPVVAMTVAEGANLLFPLRHGEDETERSASNVDDDEDGHDESDDHHDEVFELDL